MSNSPSNMHRRRLCPASDAQEALVPDEESIPSVRGSEMHRVLGSAILAEDVDLIADELQREELTITAAGFDQIVAIIPEGVEVQVERQLNLEPWGIMKTGRDGEHAMDVSWVEVIGDKRVGTIVDFKSGITLVQKAQDNDQLKTYGVAFKAEEELDEVRGYICQPRIMDKLDGGVWDHYALDAYSEIIEAVVHATKRTGDDAVFAKPAMMAEACQWCRAALAGICPARKTEMQERQDNADRKTLEHDKLIEGDPEVVGQEILVVADKALMEPLVIMDATAVAKAEELEELILEAEVTDQESADILGLLLQEATKFNSAIEKNRVKVKDPVLTLGKEVDQAAKQATGPLNNAKTVGKGKIDVWMAAERAKAEEARVAAEELAAEQEAIALKEAQKAQEAKDKAARARKPENKEKLEQEAAEAEKKASEAVAQQQTLIPVGRTVAPRVAGVKTVPKTTWEILDESKVPDTFILRTVNKVLVEAAVKGKQLEKADWIVITRGEKAVAK